MERQIPFQMMPFHLLNTSTVKNDIITVKHLVITHKSLERQIPIQDDAMSFVELNTLSASTSLWRGQTPLQMMSGHLLNMSTVKNDITTVKHLVITHKSLERQIPIQDDAMSFVEYFNCIE